MRDTLRKWLPRNKSLAADLCLSGDYMSTSEYLKANIILDSILLKYNLSLQQEDDIENIQNLYSLLSYKSIFTLNSTDLFEITEIANGIGHSASLARGLLGLYDVFYSPTYYVPGEITPRTFHKNEKTFIFSSDVSVYPNPAYRSFTIDNSISESFPISIILSDYTGKILLEKQLNKGKFEISIEQYPPGLMHIQIVTNHCVVYTGSFIKI